MKLKLKNLGNLIIDQEPELGKEYLLSIRIERSGESIDRKDPENPETTYICEYLGTELLQMVGTSKKIKVQNGRTPSQKLKFVIEEYLRSIGEDDSYENYEKEVGKIIDDYNGRILR